MDFYDDLQATATDLIDEFGQDATLKQSVMGAYDPATGSASETVTSSACRAVVTDYDIQQIDGTLIQRGDKRLLMSVIAGVSPVAGDKLMVGQSVYNIKNASPLSPGGLVLMYEIQANLIGGISFLITGDSDFLITGDGDFLIAA